MSEKIDREIDTILAKDIPGYFLEQKKHTQKIAIAYYILGVLVGVILTFIFMGGFSNKADSKQYEKLNKTTTIIEEKPI